MGSIIPQPSSEDRAAGGQRIEGSTRFNGAWNTMLQRSAAVSGNRQTWTYSAWFRRADNTVGTTDEMHLLDATKDGDENFYGIYIQGANDGDKVGYWETQNSGTATYYWALTPGALRDFQGWNHVVFNYDTTQTTSSERIRIWVNGVNNGLVAENGSYPWPTLHYNGAVNSISTPHYFGSYNEDRSFDGNLSQVYLIDGQRLDASYFGYTDPLTGIWKPKKFSGSYTKESYNLGTTWSGSSTNITNPTNAFNGSVFAGSGDCYANAGADSDGYWDLPNNIVATKVECYIDPAHTGVSGAKFYARDTGATQYTYTTTASGGDSGWVEIPLGGATRTINRVGCIRNSGGSGSALFGWRVTNTDSSGTIVTDEMLIDDVDGRGANSFYLPLDGSDAVGQDQSGIKDVNDGSTWSKYITWTNSTGFGSVAGDQPRNMFDGDDTTGAQLQGCSDPNTLIFTPPGGIDYVSKVEAYIGNSTCTVSVNGGSFNAISAGWNTIATGSGTLTSISVRRAATNGAGANGFKIDGKYLLDNTSGNSWTPKNFGGSTSIDKATGAFPILETVQGGTVSVPGVRGSVGVAVTVYNDGGGDKFYLDGEKQGTVKFVPGQTLTFNTSDSTVAGHPFRLSQVSDGGGAGVSYYSTDFDGVDGCLQFSNDAGFNFGTGAFTIEFWARVANVTQDHAAVVSLYLFGGGPFIKLRTSNEWSLYFNKDGGGNDTHDICGIGTYNEWHHLAWVREGTGANQMKLYFDGHKVYQATYPTDIVGDNSAGHGLTIGKMQPSGGSTYFEGKLRDVRISKGVARYTSDFAPPATPFTADGNTSILTCNTSTSTTNTGNYAGISTAIGGVATGNSQDPFKKYPYAMVTGAISEGTAGAATTITIPTNAPGELSYYCHNHSSMGGTVSVGATDPSIADPHAWKCRLALPMTDAKDYSALVNCATPTQSITNSGIDFVYKRKNFYGTAGDLTGASDDALSTGDYDNGYRIGRDDFTIEMWVYSTSDSGTQNFCQIIGDGGSTSYFGIWYSSSNIYFQIEKSGGAGSVSAGSIVVGKERWCHLAMTRSGGFMRGYVDGVKIVEKEDTSYLDDTGYQVHVGRHEPANNGMTGYMQDFRFYRGVAKYPVEGFIPASTLPDVLPQTPSGVAYESLLTEQTTGSVLFDRSTISNYLFLNDDAHSGISVGSADFTIEGWLYKTTSADYPVIVDTRESGNSDANGFFFGTNTDSQIYYYTQSTNLIKTKVINNYTWYHFALVRSSNTTTLYIDGISTGSGSDNVNYTNNIKKIGASSNSVANDWDWPGYLSNVRITIGQALYTSPFAPPTEPLTTTSQGAVAGNVKLLCCQSNLSAGAAVASPKISGINDGTVWSLGGKSDKDFEDAHPIENGFNGLADYESDYRGMTRPASDIARTATWTAPGSGIPWSTSLKLRAARDSGGSGGGSIKVNGVDVTSQYTDSTATLETVTLTGVTSPLTSIALTSEAGGRQPRFTAIYIDDVMLVDPVAVYQGKWTETMDANPFDKDIHTVRGQEAQYATLSPVNTMDTNATFSDGNLHAQVTGPCTIASSIPMFRGKWYCEIINTAHGSTHTGMGIAKIECCDGARQPDEAQHRGGWGMWHISGDGSYRKIGFGASWGSQSTTWEDWGATWGTNGDFDVMGLALDMDNRTLTYYKNGVNMGTNENNLTRILKWGDKIDAANDNGTKIANTSWADGDYGMVFVIGNGQTGATSDFECNFGQRPWLFAPPPGFEAATTANCYPRPPLVRPDKQYFKPVTYTGNNSADTSGTGNTWGIPVDVGFTPDLVMLKSRTQTYGWYVYDSIRKGDKPSGTPVPGADIQCYDWLELNDTDASTNSAYGNGIGIRKDGFNVDIDGQGVGEAGQGADNMVAWCWKAGGYKGTWNKNGVDVSNYTNAGLNYGDTAKLTAASVNTDAGFSIVTWTQDGGGAGSQIAHGLTRAPNFVIMKHYNNTSNWFVVHSGSETTSGGKILYMNTDSGDDTSSDFANVFPGATYTATSTTGVSGRKVIMYSWHNVEGLQKFGQYEGNGSSTKGVYVHLGFKPAMVWTKRVDSTGDWRGWDNGRMSTNPNSMALAMNTTAAQLNSSDYYIDFLSDGFKFYSSDSTFNNNGSKFCYSAWADTPTNNLYA